MEFFVSNPVRVGMQLYLKKDSMFSCKFCHILLEKRLYNTSENLVLKTAVYLRVTSMGIPPGISYFSLKGCLKKS